MVGKMYWAFEEIWKLQKSKKKGAEKTGNFLLHKQRKQKEEWSKTK